MLPDKQEAGQHREALRVNVQGPRAFRERSNSQLLEQCILKERTQQTMRKEMQNKSKGYGRYLRFICQYVSRRDLEKNPVVQQIRKVR